MYVLDLLNGWISAPPGSELVSFEYRLLCSGALYNSTVQTTDWRKSDATRSLIQTPFALTVCSQPPDEYPQELCLRFKAPSITETRGNSTFVFHPDEIIARDLAAILSLLLRRLITVAAKTREYHPQRNKEQPDFMIDHAVGFTNSITRVHWTHKPVTVAYGIDGITELKDYNPPPLGLDPDKLRKLLAGLAASKLAQPFVLSAQLYSQALQQFDQNIDLAYQSLISCVETIGRKALWDYQPTTAEMVKTKNSVLKMATKFGLTQDKAEALAIEACKGISWAAKKFTKFLVEHAGDAIWEKDNLFHPLEMLLPKKADLEKTLQSIYHARGGVTHEGHSYPATVSIGIGPFISADALRGIDFLSPTAEVPPVVWFERLVNIAINHLIATEAASYST